MTDYSQAFQVGPITVRWYGVIIATAVIIGYLVAHYRVIHRGKSTDELSNILIVTVLSAVVGARALFVAVNFSSFNGDLRGMVAIWNGGLTIHGALIGGLTGLYLYTRLRRLDFLWWADILAPSVILGQAIGRWGNYLNQEVFGYPTKLPWGIAIDPQHRPLQFSEVGYFHPTFLYESLLNLVVFAVLIVVARRQKADPKAWPEGSIALLYLLLYSIVRFIVEIFRIEPRTIGPLSLAQIASVAIAAGAAWGLVYMRGRATAR